VDDAPVLPGFEGLYFFLSHAHAAGADPGADPDHWVRAVFADLSSEVRKRSRERPGWQAGAFRPCTAAPADVDEWVDRAIAAAGVFVALYSPAYLVDERALAQKEAFAGARILPVVWEPAPGGGRSPDFDEAVAISPEIAEYADTGLLALSRLRSTRDQYQKILAFLGDWIVCVVDGRQPPPGRGLAVRRPHAPVSRAAFVVAVLALSGGRLDGLAGRVTGLVDADRFEPKLAGFQRGSGQFARSPGLLLVDPWILDAADGEARLRQAVADLPAWALPVVVADSADAVHAAGSDAWQAVRMLVGNAAPRPRVVPEPDAVGAQLRGLIAEACGRYEAAHRGAQRARPFRPRVRMMDANSEAEELP
jgi:hypothetical protein